MRGTLQRESAKCILRQTPGALHGFQHRYRQEELVEHIEDDDYLIYLRDKGVPPCF